MVLNKLWVFRVFYSIQAFRALGLGTGWNPCICL